MRKEYTKPEIDAYDFHRKTDLILTDSAPTSSYEEESIDDENDTSNDLTTPDNSTEVIL